MIRSHSLGKVWAPFCAADIKVEQTCVVTALILLRGVCTDGLVRKQTWSGPPEGPLQCLVRKFSPSFPSWKSGDLQDLSSDVTAGREKSASAKITAAPDLHFGVFFYCISSFKQLLQNNGSTSQQRWSPEVRFMTSVSGISVPLLSCTPDLC